jgi:hypothetical protein
MPKPPLSPAAQAVMDAFLDSAVDAGNYYATRSHQIAAALCAIADQVVPEESKPLDQLFADPNDPWPVWYANNKTRRKLLAIATELRNHQ